MPTDPGSEAASTSSDVTSNVSINGAQTGAMVRETTPAGFVRIATTVTVPDFDPDTPGEPWVYFGFSDEISIDMEIGLSFQHGDGTASFPHRYLPYTRLGKTFWFGDESTRIMPGHTVALEARLSSGKVTLERDGQPVIFWTDTYCGGPLLRACAGPSIDGMAMPTLAPAATHVRRVVGLATETAYHGEPLGKFGPVVFRSTRLGANDRADVLFDAVGKWSETSDGVLRGSANYPAKLVQKLSSRAASTDVDTITLFPGSP